MYVVFYGLLQLVDFMFINYLLILLVVYFMCVFHYYVRFDSFYAVSLFFSVFGSLASAFRLYFNFFCSFECNKDYFGAMNVCRFKVWNYYIVYSYFIENCARYASTSTIDFFSQFFSRFFPVC